MRVSIIDIVNGVLGLNKNCMVGVMASVVNVLKLL